MCSLPPKKIFGLATPLFEDADRPPVTMNTDRTIHLTNNKNFIPALRWKRVVDMDTAIYQQNRVTFLWGFLKDRVYSNNDQNIDALKNTIQTDIRRIPHEMLDSVTTNLNVRIATVIQRQETWIEHNMNCWAVLAKCWCTKRKRTPHKTCMSVRQADEKSCQVFLSIKNATFSKMDTSFGNTLHLFLNDPFIYILLNIFL